MNTVKRAVKTNRFVCRMYALPKQTLTFVSTFFISRTRWKLPFALRILCLIFFLFFFHHFVHTAMRLSYTHLIHSSHFVNILHSTQYIFYTTSILYTIQIHTGCILNILQIILFKYYSSLRFSNTPNSFSILYLQTSYNMYIREKK